MEELKSNTFSVTYSTGEVVIVKSSSFRDLEEIEILEKEILKCFVTADACPGDLLKLSNKGFWGHVEKLAKLLPIVGQDEKGLNLDLIEDADDILRIFVTSTSRRDPETGSIILGAEESLGVSEVCRINGLNFSRILKTVLIILRNEKPLLQEE